MDLVSQAIALLSETEESLRQLMASGLAAQDYSAISQIAVIADRLAQLNAAVAPARDDATTPQAAVPAVSIGNASTALVDLPDIKAMESTNPPSNRRKYPRFERDGDRLVKIGWSDRDRRAYEHRAPRAAVLEVCEALGKRSTRGRRFKMEEVLPELAESKEPVPSYQGYLTLAWLRSEGVVERDGKDGYMVRGGLLSADRVEKLWGSLSERSKR